MKSYLLWLLENLGHDSIYSQLIAYVYRDTKFPRRSTNYDKIRDYLIFTNASNDIIDEFEQSWDLYLEMNNEEG